MSLLNESVGQVTLTADTAPERPHLPLPEALRDDLRLADRGYFDREYLGAVDRAGGYFVMRASASVNPKVQGAYTWEGEALEGWSGQLLKQGILSKGETVDLDVVSLLPMRSSTKRRRIHALLSQSAGRTTDSRMLRAVTRTRLPSLAR